MGLFDGIADLLQPEDNNPPKQDLTAEVWFNDFTSWLEGDYITKHQRVRTPGLHASELFRVCPRAIWLDHVFKPPKEVIKAGQQATFDVGHALHWWWQHRYLGPKGELYGDWTCSSCKTETKGTMPLNCPCGAPWQENMLYGELPVEDKRLKYTGHTDGILIDKNGVRRIFEFKTSSPTDFKSITAPKESHIIQAHAYMRLLGPTETLIVYQNKGSQCEWAFGPDGIKPGKLNIKPFIVKFDQAFWNKIEQRILDCEKVALELQAILDEKKQVPMSKIESCSRICQSKNDDAAKYCPVKEWCFKLIAPGDPPKKDIEGERIPL